MNGTENQSRLSTIVRTCRLIGRMCRANPAVPESHGLYYQMLGDYYSRLLEAKIEGYFIAAHTIFFPVEILYAMDIVPLHTEMTAWITALFTGSCADLLANSAKVGLASEICSPYRVLAGAEDAGVLPRPDVVVWTNLICDNAGKGGELTAHLAGCPGFFVDCPFQKTDIENSYWKQEIREVIAFLEKQAGRKMDWDKLSAGIDRMDRQIELVREINDLRRNTPSPFPPQDFLKLFTVDCLFAGQPEATRYLEKVRQELIETIQRKSKDPSKERFRILNLMMPPVLLLDKIEKISAEYGAVSVADPFFCHWGKGRLDSKIPLESVLKKMEMHPVMVMYGPLDQRVREIIRDTSLNYKIDGAIYWAHIGCRQSAALIKPIKDALNDMDIPVLILDSDIIDVTVTPEEELQKKLRQFFELLEDR